MQTLSIRLQQDSTVACHTSFSPAVIYFYIYIIKLSNRDKKIIFFINSL